ncbi:hypothetical protein YC2023_050667 [Brassica napus]
MKIEHIKKYRVFEYHMEFLETLVHLQLKGGDKSDLWTSTAWSDFPERLHEVAVHHIPDRLSQSYCTKSLAFSRPETHRFDPGATSQSDVPKSLPMFRATCWSDTPRSLASYRPETPKSSILERPFKATYQGRSQPERPARRNYLKSLQPERSARATSSSRSRFDGARHEETRRERPPGAAMIGRSACFAWTIFMLFQGPFGHLFCCFTLPKPKLSTLVSHWRQRISFLENN